MKVSILYARFLHHDSARSKIFLPSPGFKKLVKKTKVTNDATEHSEKMLEKYKYIRTENTFQQNQVLYFSL